MKKRIALLLAGLLAIGSLTACGGNNGSNANTGNNGDTVNVGLGLYTQMNSSKSASADADGLAEADLTLAAVTLNADGTIASVKVDSLQVKTSFDATGNITSDTGAQILTKKEIGDNYSMKPVSASMGKIEGGAEWYEQAEAFEAFCVGKTIDQVKAAMNSEFYAQDDILVLGCTIKINGFVAALEKACAEAATGTYTATAGDELKLAVIANVDSPANASADENGSATAYANFVAVTSKDGAITACVLDAVQAKITWDATGVITSDLSVDTTTKHDLKDSYGMKNVSATMGKIEGGAEWYEQADTFMAFVKGMNAEQVKSIAVDADGYPTDATLTLGCTVNVNGFISLVDKALSK